jgi:hypothetical protein
MLYCGLVEHLESNGLSEMCKDMRLSVFRDNMAACGLYEKLGFDQDGESWSSDLQHWPWTDEEKMQEKKEGRWTTNEPEPCRTIEWKRYRRLDPGTNPDLLKQLFCQIVVEKLQKNGVDKPGGLLGDGSSGSHNSVISGASGHGGGGGAHNTATRSRGKVGSEDKIETSSKRRKKNG